MRPKAKPRTPKDTDLIFTTSQWLPTPLEETFAFFAEARNLERITPAFLSFRVVTPGHIEMHPGALIDYQLRVRGFPVSWQTEITDWDPPNGFTDVQLRGPYQKWIHRHDFRSENGGTRVEDTVNYLVPGGALIDRFMVKPELRRIFEYRRAKIEELFERIHEQES